MNQTALLGIALALSVGCSSPDSQIIKLSPGEAKTLTAFSSASRDSVRARLLLKADSTFLLEMGGPTVVSRRITGPLRAASGQYQLFFPDSIEHLNELITSVHPDASVVVYPDGSVVLDQALDQLYVRGSLLTKDTLTESR